MAGAAEPVPVRAPALQAGAAPDALRWLRLRPPLLALLLTGSALAAHALVLRLAAPAGRAPLAGALLAAGGLGWMLWAAWSFRRAETTLRPLGLPAVLVEDGPYRVGRNPMYLGMALAMAGLAVALGAPTLLLATGAFVAIVGRFHVRHEEAVLRATFGGWYSDYAARVRRWL